MASIRKQVMDAIVVALEQITKSNGYNTNIKYVSTDLNVEHPDQLDKRQFPACFPYDDTEVKEQLTLFDDVDGDMQSTLTIIVTSMVFERSGSTLEKRTDLLQDVEKALVTDVNLTALLLEEVTPIEVNTDKGFFKNFSVFDQTFEVVYNYNHLDGG